MLHFLLHCFCYWSHCRGEILRYAFVIAVFLSWLPKCEHVILSRAIGLSAATCHPFHPKGLACDWVILAIPARGHNSELSLHHHGILHPIECVVCFKNCSIYNGCNSKWSRFIKVCRAATVAKRCGIKANMKADKLKTTLVQLSDSTSANKQLESIAAVDPCTTEVNKDEIICVFLQECSPVFNTKSVRHSSTPQLAVVAHRRTPQTNETPGIVTKDVVKIHSASSSQSRTRSLRSSAISTPQITAITPLTNGHKNSWHHDEGHCKEREHRRVFQ